MKTRSGATCVDEPEENGSSHSSGKGGREPQARRGRHIFKSPVWWLFAANRLSLPRAGPAPSSDGAKARPVGARGARAPQPGRDLALLRPRRAAPASARLCAPGRGRAAEARWEGAGGDSAVGQLQVSSWSRWRARRRAGLAM